MSESKCGTCTLCCTLCAVPELKKPARTDCIHILPNTPEAGCSIYENRPQSCRVYSCVYITTQETEDPLPPYCRPDKLHIVVSAPESLPFWVVHLDPQYPNALENPAANALLRSISAFAPIMVLGTDNVFWVPKDGEPLDLETLRRYLCMSKSAV
jgi:Fe-S-cluster containining protein